MRGGRHRRSGTARLRRCAFGAISMASQHAPFV